RGPHAAAYPYSATGARDAPGIIRSAIRARNRVRPAADNSQLSRERCLSERRRESGRGHTLRMFARRQGRLLAQGTMGANGEGADQQDAQAEQDQRLGNTDYVGQAAEEEERD